MVSGEHAAFPAVAGVMSAVRGRSACGEDVGELLQGTGAEVGQGESLLDASVAQCSRASVTSSRRCHLGREIASTHVARPSEVSSMGEVPSPTCRMIFVRL